MSRVSAPSRSPGSTPGTTTYSMTCAISDDGTLFFEDASGSPISDHLVEVVKKQDKEAILGLIQRKCDEINEQVEALGRAHHDTSDARVKPRFVPPAYAEPEPLMPKPQPLGVPAILHR